MFLVTTLGVFLVSCGVIPLFGLIFGHNVNFFLENLIVSAVIVGLLTWAVMPFLSRVVFQKWLYR